MSLSNSCIFIDCKSTVRVYDDESKGLKFDRTLQFPVAHWDGGVNSPPIFFTISVPPQALHLNAMYWHNKRLFLALITVPRTQTSFPDLIRKLL